MNLAANVVVLVVSFRNPEDVVACVRALANASPNPSIEIFIAENGGAQAMDGLVDRLVEADGFYQIEPNCDIPMDPRLVLRRRRVQWSGPDGVPRMWINIAEMAENLGYAGGVNAWLRPLLQVGRWKGAWILNPDAEPQPTALAELVAYAAARRKGMVGSRLIPFANSDQVHSRGLAWRKLVAKTEAVDYHASSATTPDPDDVDARIDSPSGASLYVTRAMIEAIGLMDERYFLYFEDLDWGIRAKAMGGVGYAHASIVAHKGGTTTNPGDHAKVPSKLTVYLEFRNRILFVRSRHPTWLPWTIVMQIVHAASFLTAGSLGRVVPAIRGLIAGLLGEVGRPDRIIAAWGRQRRA